MFQKNYLRYSLFPSPTLRIVYSFIMREDRAELFPDTVLRKSLSPRSTKGCDISACLHVALAFPIAASHRIAHGTSRFATPLRSNQLPFMSTPARSPTILAHRPATSVLICLALRVTTILHHRGPIHGLCSKPLFHRSLTDSVL
jgi:hypothetical protein